MSAEAFKEAKRREFDAIEREMARQEIRGWRIISFGWGGGPEITEAEIDAFIAADRRMWDERARLSDLAAANPFKCQAGEPVCSGSVGARGR